MILVGELSVQLKLIGQKMFYVWRVFATGFSFFLFGVGGVIITVILFPLIFLLSRDRLKRIRYSRRLVSFAFKGFIKVMRVLGIMTWSVTNSERLDREGLIVVANHPTLLDIVFLISLLPNADCIVKRELLKNPAMRGALGLTGYIINDSGVDLVDDAIRSIAEGSNIVVFPEGTRSAGELNKFKRGVANIALKNGSDLTPVVIDCSESTLRKNQPWYQIPTHPFHVTLSIQEDISVDLFMTSERRIGVRRLTQDLESYFSDKLEEIRC